MRVRIHTPLLELQRVHGNRTAQRLLYAPSLRVQRQPATPPFSFETGDWAKAVELAEKGKGKKTDAAARAYKTLIARAAQQITAPPPLADKKPTPDDIRFKWTKTLTDAAATADPKRVDDHPDDYWKWIAFNPDALKNEEVFTASVIAHELDHAAHAKALYEEWKKAGKKGKWDDFYVEHFGKWTEPQIKVGEAAGLVGAIEGLPTRIQPSAIEFRAYANQLVQFFHRYSIDKQSYIARAVVLYYPLKKQEVKAEIADPGLSLAAARDAVLAYFRSPPGTSDQQEVIRLRMVKEFKSALFLFRPKGDIDAIKRDFKEIFDYAAEEEAMKEARKKYVPQK